MRVATIQFCPIFKDKAINLQRAVGLVTQAASNGAELIVLPELCTTGYSLMTPAEALSQAEPVEHSAPTMAVFEELATKLQVAVVWGMVEIDPGTGNLYNAQVLITPNREYISYRKINPWGNDWLWAKPGRSNPPIMSYKGKKIGLLICRDIRDKKDDSWKSFYEKGDADVVCLSANWGDGGFPAVTWMEFAQDNGAILVVSNRYGKEIPNDFGEGGICVIYPDHKVVTEGLVWNQDCIVYAEV